MSVPGRMLKAIELFKAKNKDRGDSYRKAGDIFSKFCPDGITIKTKEDFNVFFTITQLIDCLTRIITLFAKGDDANFESIFDSARDCGVYSFILAELLEEWENMKFVNKKSFEDSMERVTEVVAETSKKSSEVLGDLGEKLRESAENTPDSVVGSLGPEMSKAGSELRKIIKRLAEENFSKSIIEKLRELAEDEEDEIQLAIDRLKSFQEFKKLGFHEIDTSDEYQKFMGDSDFIVISHYGSLMLDVAVRGEIGWHTKIEKRIILKVDAADSIEEYRKGKTAIVRAHILEEHKQDRDFIGLKDYPISFKKPFDRERGFNTRLGLRIIEGL